MLIEREATDHCQWCRQADLKTHIPGYDAVTFEAAEDGERLARRRRVAKRTQAHGIGLDARPQARQRGALTATSLHRARQRRVEQSTHQARAAVAAQNSA